jgi:hypothetical protein
LKPEDLTPTERILIDAARNMEDLGKSEKPRVLHDPLYAKEAEHLVELGFFEKVELVHRDDQRELVGWRLAPAARAGHLAAGLIETAQESRN